VARSAEVLTAGIGQEDIGPASQALRMSCHPVSGRGKGRQVRIIRYCHQEIGVFGVWLVVRQGPDERDPLDPREAAGRSHECHDLRE
jgi:hypothetical protein